MTDEGVTDRTEEICPYLGLTEDSAIRHLGASPLHRCHSGSPPLPVSMRAQEIYCLSGAYPSCPHWQGETDLFDGEEEGILFGWDWSELRDRMGRAGLELLAGFIRIAWAMLAVVAFIVLAPLLGAPGSGTKAGENPLGGSLPTEQMAWSGSSGDPATAVPLEPGAMSSVVPAVPESGATPSPGRATVAASAGQPVPSPAPSLVVAAGPTPRNAPATPVPQSRTYVVQPKDTLWSVARTFGVSVDELARVNGLKDKNVLRAGQKLIIPGS